MRRFRIAVAVATAASALGSGLWGGGLGLAGFGLGVAASVFNLGALWGITEIAARAARSVGTAKPATALIVLAFFLKVPLFLLLGWFAWELDGAAPTCFLVGLGLVYSAFVGWALARS